VTADFQNTPHRAGDASDTPRDATWNDQTPILEVEDVSLSFGGVRALANVSFGVPANQITTIIGPNGAGKTSSLFKGMNVLDNIKLGAHWQMRTGPLDALFYFGKARREEMALRDEVERKIIDFLEIDHIRNHSVGSLSYGLQKRIELARALAMRPSVLMLDEPVAGMTREEKEDMARFILDVKEELDVTVLMVEHDMGLVMDISDQVVVLNFGEIIAMGRPDEVREDPDVIAAYLGSGGIQNVRDRLAKHGEA
jgi:branched-chain amino acid transport system ATP-binding protein